MLYRSVLQAGQTNGYHCRTVQIYNMNIVYCYVGIHVYLFHESTPEEVMTALRCLAGVLFTLTAGKRLFM